MQLLREAPSVTTHGTLSGVLPPPYTISARPSSSPRPPLGSPHHTHSQSRFSHWLQPRFPLAESQISHSIKPFIPSTVTQPQHEPVSPRRDLTKAFIPSQPEHREALALLPEPWAPALTLGVLTQLCHRSSDLLPCKGSQVTSSWLLGSHPKLNLQLANQATCSRCVPQHKQNARWLLGFKQETKP